MGFSYLLSSEALLASCRATSNDPKDVDIAYCHEGDIDIQRRHGVNTVFFPLMAILEGGVRFPVDPLIIGTLRFEMLVGTENPYLHLLISCSCIELISLFFVNLLQNQKGSNQISELYTYKISILYLDQKSSFIRMDSSEHLT